MKVPSQLLQDRITIRPYLGDTGRGPAWGDPVEVRARVEPTDRRIVRANGVEVHASAVATVRPDVAVSPEAKAEWAGRDYLVVSVDDMQGLSSTAMRKLVLS